MADDLAQVADVVKRWRTLTADEQNLASVLISDASDMIRRRPWDVDSRIANGTLDVATVTRVVAQMVRRAMMNRNVDGITQQTDVAGPYTQSQSFANPSGNLYFTAEEIADLAPWGFFPRTRQGWAG